MWSEDMWHMRRCGCSHPTPAIRVAVMSRDGHAVRTTYAMEILNATTLFKGPPSQPDMANPLVQLAHTSTTASWA